MRQKQANEEAAKKRAEEEERDKLKNDWLNLLFTDQSVAAMSPEGPLPISFEGGELRSPSKLIVFVGDHAKVENTVLQELLPSIGTAGLLSISWSQHPAAEAYAQFSLKAPEVVDGSWYMRDRAAFENPDLDMLHDVEVLGRSLVETLEPKLAEFALDWRNVVLVGFGK